MMRYIHIVHFDTKAFDAQSLDYRQDVDRRALAKNAELVERGVLVHAEAIQSPDTAVLVRVRDGKVSVTDGPYMETKEQMAGFVLWLACTTSRFTAATARSRRIATGSPTRTCTSQCSPGGRR